MSSGNMQEEQKFRGGEGWTAAWLNERMAGIATEQRVH